MKRVGLRSSLIAIVLLALAMPSTAEEVSLVPKWEIDVGSFYTNTSTDVRADSNVNERGTRFNLEDALGLKKDETVVILAVAHRLRKRHVIRLFWSDYSRDGRTEIPFEIDFRGTTYPVDAVVDSTWDFTWIELRYTYFFSLGERTGWGVVGALGNWDIDLTMAASDPRIQRELRTSIVIDELIPELGFEVRHKLGSRVILRSNLTGLAADFGDQKARLLNLALRFDFMFSQKVGLAILGSTTDVNWEDRSGLFTGDYDYRVDGAQVHITLDLD